MGYIYIIQTPECYNSIHEQDRRTYKIGMTTKDDPEDRLAGYVGIRSARIYSITRVRNEKECEDELKSLFTKIFKLAPRGKEYFVGDIMLMIKMVYMVSQDYIYDESTPSILKMDSESSAINSAQLPPPLFTVLPKQLDIIDQSNIKEVVKVIIKDKMDDKKFEGMIGIVKQVKSDKDCIFICRVLLRCDFFIGVGWSMRFTHEFGLIFATVCADIFDSIRAKYYRIIYEAIAPSHIEIVKKELGNTKWEQLFSRATKTTKKIK